MPTSWSDYKHFIFLSFAAGIGEEIMFRGFMINYIYSISQDTGYSYLLAILIPALLFSLAHIYQGILSVVKIMCISILFGAIYIWSESLLIVCIIHVLVDLVSGALLVLLFNKNKANSL
jgi:membrane protease YdiL (CAAX protease family)